MKEGNLYKLSLLEKDTCPRNATAEDPCGSVLNISALMSSPAEPVSPTHSLSTTSTVCILGHMLIHSFPESFDERVDTRTCMNKLWFYWFYPSDYFLTRSSNFLEL